MRHTLSRRDALKVMAGAGLGAAFLPAVARAAAPVAAPTPEEVAGMETIKRRLREAALAGTPPTAEAEGYLRSLRPDGTWPDIDYADQTRSGWKASQHLPRVRTMALAYRRAPAGPAGAALKKGILLALDNWLTHDYQNPNWWHNVIGTPQSMSAVLLLMEADLSPQQIQAGLKIVERGKLGMTGQNLVWVADLTIRRGCLAGDAASVKRAFESVAGEIRISEKEGIQADYSFHQHGAQLYSGGYGRGFSSDCPRLAALADGTPFRFAKEKLDIVADYLTEGQQWFVRGRTFDYSAIGRELARRGHNAGGLSTAAETMARLCPDRRTALDAMARRLGTATPAPEQQLTGNRHYWCSDIMVHRRSGYSTSVRMASTRMRRSEIVNSENLKGYHLADGANYLYLSGDEYRDIFPAWDWERVPGITCEVGAKPVPLGPGATTFAGGVSDGTYGLAAYDFAMAALKARKAWFFFDKEFVCLGAGITCPTDNTVITSVNQCLTQAAARVNGRGWEHGRGWFDDSGWVWHDGVAYVFPEANRHCIAREKQTGSWQSINAAASGQEISLDVFSLWIDHGAQAAGKTYCYVVVPGMEEKDVPGYAAALPVAVLSNTPELQAVRHAGLGITQASFYVPGKLDSKAGPSLAVDAPCLVQVRETPGTLELAVSNPVNRPGTVNVDVGRHLNGEGCAWSAAAGTTRVAIQLPDGLFAGQSVVRKLLAG